MPLSAEIASPAFQRGRNDNRQQRYLPYGQLTSRPTRQVFSLSEGGLLFVGQAFQPASLEMSMMAGWKACLTNL